MSKRHTQIPPADRVTLVEHLVSEGKAAVSSTAMWARVVAISACGKHMSQAACLRVPAKVAHDLWESYCNAPTDGFKPTYPKDNEVLGTVENPGTMMRKLFAAAPYQVFAESTRFRVEIVGSWNPFHF